MTSVNLNSSVLKKYRDQDKKNEKNSDYQNIIDYKVNNNEKAFNNLYIKYEKYIYSYSEYIYNVLKAYGNYLSQDDIFQNLTINCFLAVISQIKIEKIQENFSLKVFLSQNLRLFSKFYIKKYSKVKEYNIDFDNIYNTSQNETKDNFQNYFMLKQKSKERWKKRFSYDPTNNYIFHVDNIKEKIRQNLNEKENKFFDCMLKGYTLKRISKSVGIQMGSIGSFKKHLQDKIKTIIEKENLI